MNPLAVSAVTARTWFLLGAANCSSGSCATFVRSTDAGRTFTDLSVPAISPAALSDASVVFPDERDGYLVTAGRAYLTDDGGRRWRILRLARSVDSIATGGGDAYAVVAGRGASEILERSPAGQDHFQEVPLPLGQVTRAQGFRISLGVLGPDLFVLVTSDAGGPGALLFSPNRGSTVRRSISEAGCLGGTIVPEEVKTLWMQCVTGLMSHVMRSDDMGRAFASTRDMELCNCAVLGAASSANAVVGQMGERLELLSGGGRGVHAVGPPADSDYTWSSIQFTDPSDGLALRMSEEPGLRPNQLWRTSDGGHQWSLVHVT